LSTIFSLATRLNNEYFELTNSKGKRAILFVKNGLIFAPECVKVQNVTILAHTEQCFKELLVNFVYKGNQKLGYLTGKIIRDITKQIDCKDDSDVIFLEGEYFQRKNKDILMGNLNEIKWVKVNTLTDNFRINTHHTEAIMSSTNELEMFFELEKRIINEHGSLAEPVRDELANNVIGKYVDEIKNTLMNPFRIAKNYIFIIGLGVIIMVISICGLWICCKTGACGCFKLCKYGFQKWKRNKKPQTIIKQDIPLTNLTANIDKVETENLLSQEDLFINSIF